MRSSNTLRYKRSISILLEKWPSLTVASMHARLTQARNLIQNAIPTFCSENVLSGDVLEAMNENLQEHYDTALIKTKPSDVGFRYCSRDRGYLIGVNKAWGCLAGDPAETYDLLCSGFTPDIDPREFWWMEKDADLCLEQHKLSTANRPNSRGPNDFANTLSGAEHDNVDAYGRRFAEMLGKGTCSFILLK